MKLRAHLKENQLRSSNKFLDFLLTSAKTGNKSYHLLFQFSHQRGWWLPVKQTISPDSFRATNYTFVPRGRTNSVPSKILPRPLLMMARANERTTYMLRRYKSHQLMANDWWTIREWHDPAARQDHPSCLGTNRHHWFFRCFLIADG